MSEQKSLFKAYIWGLVLCVIITAASFLAVGKQLLTGNALFFAIIVFAVLQFLVQVKCFLHLSLKPDARWNVITLIFTVIVLLILVFGSIWIMHSLDMKMMVH